MRRNGIGPLLGAVALTAMLAGCSALSEPDPFEHHEVSRHGDAGAVNLSVTMIAPWNDYVDRLSPDFELSSKAALQKVIPTTTRVEQKAIDALTGSLAIGARGARAAASAAEEAEGAGDDGGEAAGNGGVALPELPDPAAGERTARDQTGIDERGEGLGQDVHLQYTAATALYQEVQLLNRYVKDAALKADRAVYLLRLQFNVMPFARNQPYDVFTTVGFFPNNPQKYDSEAETDEAETDEAETEEAETEEAETDEDAAPVYCGGEDPPDGLEILPLLVTDNLEGALKSNSAEVIRQLGLALGYMQGNIGAEAALSSSSERALGVLGTDVNSLLTVGRTTDNTLMIRLGAARQASARFAMLPRTHWITAALMVPKECAQTKPPPDIQAVARTTFRHAMTGRALRQEDPGGNDRAVAAVIARYCRGGAPADHVCSETVRDMPDSDEFKDLMGAIYRNDYDRFREEIESDRLNGGRDDLWLDIVKTLQAHHRTAIDFGLPNGALPVKPPEQQVLLIDDGTTIATQVHGGKALRSDRLAAELTVDGVTLPARRIEVAEGRVELTFPSFEAWRISPTIESGTRLKDAGLSLTIEGVARQEYRRVHYRAPEQKPFVPFKFAAAQKFVTATGGKLGFFVDVEEAALKARNLSVAQVEIAVDGATIEVAKAATPCGRLSGAIRTRLNTVSVPGDCHLHLHFGNLRAGKTITLQAKALGPDEAPVGEPAAPIAIDIVKADG